MRAKGFTLLEVIFVLVVIAVITLTGFRLISFRVQQVRVDNTATTLKHWLNAARNYYVDNNQWPATLETLIPSYVSQDHLKNAWGLAFSVASDNAPDAKRFGVQAATPRVDFAKRVAAQLSSVAPNPPTSAIVTSYISVPIDIPQKRMQMIAIREFDINNPSPLYFYIDVTGGLSCPYEGWTMHFQAALKSAYFKGAVQSTGACPVRSLSVAKFDNRYAFIRTTYSGSFIGCPTIFSGPVPKPSNNGALVAFVWCCPPPGAGVECPDD